MQVIKSQEKKSSHLLASQEKDIDEAKNLPGFPYLFHLSHHEGWVGMASNSYPYDNWSAQRREGLVGVQLQEYLDEARQLQLVVCHHCVLQTFHCFNTILLYTKSNIK